MANALWLSCRRGDTTKSLAEQGSPGMPIIIQHVTFSLGHLAALPPAEQLLFLGLARVLNDLRYVKSLVGSASESLKSSSGEGRKEDLHHLVFSLRILYGTLYEGWDLIKRCWSRDKLGKTFYTTLPQDAREAFQFLNKYFGTSNYVRKIRNNLAFHYNDEFQACLKRADASEPYSMIVGRINGNQFFAFSEALHRIAIAEIADIDDPEVAIGKFVDEAYLDLLPKFVLFADAVLYEIALSFLPDTEAAEINPVADAN